MLDHVSITVDDLDAAVTFYDATLTTLGHHRVYRTETAAGYGPRNSATDDSYSYLSIVAQPTVRPDARHWAFRARSRAEVDAFHRAALASGGRDAPIDAFLDVVDFATLHTTITPREPATTIAGFDRPTNPRRNITTGPPG
jgi:catechol 2,3-dioxygenase-like lactoylglutathione lyase family enzyme